MIYAHVLHHTLLCQGSHWIPRRQVHRRLGDGLHQLWRQVLLVDGNLEHVFVEPFVGHDEVAFGAALGTPRVLHAVLARPLVSLLAVVACEHHGMRHARLTVQQAILLGHAQLCAQQQLVVEHAQVHACLLGCQELGHLAAKPHRFARIDGGHHRVPNGVDGRVHVAHHVPLHHVAQVLDGVHLAVLVAWVVDQRHVLGQVHLHEISHESPRRQIAVLVVHALGVVVAPVEPLRGGAQVGQQDGVHRGQHALLPGHQLFKGRAFPERSPQLRRKLAQLQRQRPVHGARVGRRSRVRIRQLGHQPVLRHQVDHHAPLPAVVHRC
mmetsp:Transcript_2267/g.6727  ORF Transcript_2267/g.6727 Transcript_2267/m.6727 type:complete len:323 (-) Transcript_2267:951-1919(-)